jgi:hypothetical protein
MRAATRFLATAVAALAVSCAGAAAAPPAATAGVDQGAPGPAALPAAQEAWWQGLRSLCGQAFAGTLAVGDPVLDADFAAQPLAMEVRRCGETRIEVPFHVGDDRSRTWMITRTATGLWLAHDHRHADGSEDDVTLYGGHTAEPGTATAQHFPVDERSRRLFVEHGLPQSVTNVWSVEVVPGERFSYHLRRPGRHVQVDFDLARPVAAPPPPWREEPVGAPAGADDPP